MKLSSSALLRFLNKPDPAISVLLLYGPDHGLVGERAKAIENNYLGDDAGPFSQTILTQPDLKNDPAVLQDEFCALALGGGARVVRLKTTADQSAKSVISLLAALDQGKIRPAALLLIEAGDLGPRSGLRKAVEQNKTNAATIACYAPSVGDLRALAQAQADACGLRYGPGALDLLIARLPQDRALAGSEVEKLMLYCAQSDGHQIDIADINAIVIDSLELGLDQFSFAVASGAFAQADQLLQNALEAGQSPIALLRALQRHFARLNEAKSALDVGKDIKSAMASLRPPVFFNAQQRFSRQLQAWSGPALRRTMALCLVTERAMKSSGSIPDNLLARLVVKVCAGRTKR